MDGQISSRHGSGYRLAVDGDACLVAGPAGDSQIKCELGRLGRGDGYFDVAIPGHIRLLRNREGGAVFEMPIESGIIVEVEIQAVTAGAVEIAGKGSDGALEIRRAAGRVVPGIANGNAGRRVERERIGITVERAA